MFSCKCAVCVHYVQFCRCICLSIPFCSTLTMLSVKWILSICKSGRGTNFLYSVYIE